MRKKYLAFLLFLFLVPTMNAKADIRYDLETVNVTESNITITGWAIKKGTDHCGAPGSSAPGGIQYVYSNSRCSTSKNQPVYKIAIVDAASGKEIASKTATRTGKNSMTCAMYPTESANKSCYYNESGTYSDGKRDLPSSIKSEHYLVRNYNVERRGGHYYDDVGWTVTLPTSGVKDGGQYYLTLTVFGETQKLGFQAEKVSGTSKFTLVNAEGTVNVVEVGYTGILKGGQVILSGGTYENLFNHGIYTYSSRFGSNDSYMHIVYGIQQYYYVGTTNGSASSRVSPGSAMSFYVPAVWTKGNTGTTYTLLSLCDPEKDNCELNKEEVDHKEVYCYQGKDTIPPNAADGKTGKPANTYASGIIGINTYCNVSCEEQVILTFPDNQSVDKAGMSFSFEPLTLEATKTCATDDDGWLLGSNTGSRTYRTKFNMQQWVRDWNNVNRQIPSAYTAWAKAYINLEDYNDGYWIERSHHKTGCNAHYCANEYWYEVRKCSGKGEERTCWYEDRCRCTSYDDEPQYVWRTTYGGSGTTWECREASVRRRFESAESSTRRTYQNLVNRQQTLLRQLKECNNWTDPFDVDPTVTITIEDPYGNGRYENLQLSGNEETSSISGSTTRPSVSTTDCTDCAAAVPEVECPSPRDLYCWNGSVPEPIYGAWKKVWNFTRTYELPKVWINVVTGEIDESRPTYTYSPSGGERVYYTNPYTAEGTYDITVNFGTPKVADNNAIIMGNSSKYPNKKTYHTRTLNCTYSINQYTYCDPTDEDCEGAITITEEDPKCTTPPCVPTITIIEPYNVSYYFRTIALTDVFPNNRTPGWNWRSNQSLINEIERLGEGLYKKKPKYQITLTVQAMNNVRKSNKDMGYRYGSFTGFNFNSGKSEFLSGVRSLGVTLTKN